jgi:CRP/FNR family cyclic AMP-dependent transcriptional regulator
MSHRLTSLIEQNQTPFRGSLPTTLLGLDRATLEEVTRRVRLKRGHAFGGRGKPCTELYVITSGQVLTRHELPSGRQALNVLGPGELFGEQALLSAGVWQGSALALADGEALALSVANIPRLALYYPAAVTGLLALVAERVARAEALGGIRAADHAPERMLQFLEEMAGKFGEPFGEETWLPLRLTQSEFAEILGMARETVVRVQSRLEADGLMRRDGRRGFWLRERGSTPRLSDHETCGAKLPQAYSRSCSA